MRKVTFKRYESLLHYFAVFVGDSWLEGRQKLVCGKVESAVRSSTASSLFKEKESVSVRVGE
jgi:hypothetical protein